LRVSLTNADVARALHDLADALEMTGEKDAAFKVRALRSGARIVDALAEPAAALLAGNRLRAVKGIGEGIARRVAELVSTGALAELEALRQSTPGALLEIARVEGIGPKTAQLIHAELGITTLDELEAAARRQALRGLPRLGARREEQILAAIARARADAGRMRLDKAEKEALPLVEALRRTPGVTRAEVAGSLRRQKDTVGDVDILVVAEGPADPVMEAFASQPTVAVTLARGPTKLSVKTRAGLQVDVRVVPPESFGAALHYFTGSKEHNIRIRALGVRRGLLINEYGVFDERGGGARLGGADENDVFAAVGLPFIPPELREDRGEIEAGLAGQLPALLTLGDLRGDLHMHTTETDGRSSLEEMVLAAAELGREYVAITDHSQALKVANGLDAERLAAQGRHIDALNERLGGRPRVLRGIEADILLDGSIDLGPAVLGTLDWVIGSVHSHFDLPRAEQTRRVIAAIESGSIDVLGHPTGRLIGKRSPYELDLDAVVAAAARCGVALECNAYPDRMDLDDTGCRLARERGALVVIDTDSHAATHLVGLAGGLRPARRGGLEARHVLNTRPLAELLEHRRARRARA
jgi:DNA polymerase (family 10)